MSHNCSAIVSIALSTTQNIDFYTHWKVVLGYNDKITNINIREFKGPTDKLRWFDYIHLTAVSDLYRGKIKHQEIDDVRLFTIASAISKNYQEFFRINK